MSIIKYLTPKIDIRCFGFEPIITGSSDLVEEHYSSEASDNTLIRADWTDMKKVIEFTY